MQAGQDNKLEQLSDLRHRNESLRKRIESAPFSRKMFPGTKEAYTKKKKRFALDFIKRCDTEIDLPLKKHEANVAAASHALQAAQHAVVACYEGVSHDVCSLYSFACKGTRTRKWDSKFLHESQKQSMTKGKVDGDILRDFMTDLFSPDSLMQVRFRTTSQKTEAVHRSYSRVNPKSITFARNFPSRIHTAVNFLNRGFANSTFSKCSVLGVPICRQSRVGRLLQKEEETDKYHARRQRSHAYKLRRSNIRFSKYNMYDRKNSLTLKEILIERA